MKKIEKEVSLFDNYVDKDAINIIETLDDYKLVQAENVAGTLFKYEVFDDLDILVANWESKEDCLAMPISNYRKSSVRKIFNHVVKQEKAKQFKRKKLADKKREDSNFLFFDDEDVDKSDVESEYDYYSRQYKPYIPSKSTGFVDKLNKSDTLVIHCEDYSTEMLCQIYKGKNWDVLRDGNIDKTELHQLLDSHDKIICLGHGTPGGLLNRQGGGFTVGDEEAEYLKNKKLFLIWCHASSFAKRYDLHGFITGNMPSDKWEARAVGFDVDEKYMDDNITYWSKCCADHVEQALRGDYEGAAKNIVRDYLALYGDETKWNEQELGITQYNAEKTTAI